MRPTPSLAALALAAALGCAPESHARVDAGGTAGTASSSTSGSSGSNSAAGTGSSGGPSGGGLPYTLIPFDRVRVGSQPGEANYQGAVATLDLVGAPFARVTLTVQLESPCYPFSKWQSDPAPQGQAFPADCDAFDRNFEWSLDGPGADGGAPGLELIRAITPFGGPENRSADLTAAANAQPGSHQLRVTIPSYSDATGRVSGSRGSWLVSAQVQVVPGMAQSRALAVTPLFYGSMTSDGSSQSATFTVPAGTRYGWLEYRVTGHGGAQDNTGSCLGPADEFCQRSHTLWLDDAGFATVTPWRSDCDRYCTLTHEGPTDAGFDYCLENPTGDPASVRAPRANWCPASETPPYVFDGGGLSQPGSHTLRWQVDGIAPNGGRWETSVTYFAIGT